MAWILGSLIPNGYGPRSARDAGGPCVPASVRENILLDQEMDDEARQRIIADSQLI